jgi:hypothetical protein
MAADRQFPTWCRWKTWPGLLLSLIGLVLADPATATAAGTTRFVAPDGNDAWSGTRTEPNAMRTDGPFATLRRAQEAVRESRMRPASERVATISIRGGTYRLRAPLVFRPEDSGSGDVPVVWEAPPGERPVLSGGRTVAGWKRGAGPLWTAEIADVKTGGWSFRQLFVNGQRRPRARLPEKGILTLAAPAKVDATGWAGAAPPASEWDRWSFQYKPGDIDRRWRNLDDVEVVVLQYWMEARLRIKAVDERNHVVLFTGGSWRPLTWSGGYYVENVFEGLGTPGSWYLDRKQGVLYYHPLPDEDMSRAEVVAPAVEQLVRLEGDAASGRLVENLTFRGLGFQHTDWRLGPQGYACEQAELPPAAAFLADGATGCRVERCDFTHLGGWGIEFRRGCRDGVVSHTTMSDLGAGCVKIGEPKNAATDLEETRQTVVSDNHFRDAGLVYLGSPAVWIGQSSGNVVSHNEISGPVMWAISAGWTWSYFPLQRARDNVIESNHCHHIGNRPARRPLCDLRPGHLAGHGDPQ